MHYHLPAHFPYTKPRTPLVRPACWTIANGHAKTKVTEGRHCTLSQGAKPLMFSAEIPVIKGAAGHSDGATQGRDWGHHLRDTPSAWRGPFKGQILVECDHLHPAGRLAERRRAVPGPRAILPNLRSREAMVLPQGGRKSLGL